MSEEVDKILCCDRGNDNALAYALAGKQNNDPMAMAAMMNGGMGNQWNNPFIYLVWMMFAQRLWNNGENKVQDAEIQAQLNSIRTQMQDNQNSNLLMDAVKGNGVAVGQLASNLNCDFNTLNSAICDVRGGVDRLAGQVGFSAERVINAANLGDMNIITAIKDCCCSNKELVQRMGYENQLGQKDIQNSIEKSITGLGYGVQSGFSGVNTGLERGFANIAYADQQNKCDIINTINAAQQRTADLLNSHWKDELSQKNQDLKFEVSQLKQNQYLASLINGGCGCPGTVGQ